MLKSPGNFGGLVHLNSSEIASMLSVSKSSTFELSCCADVTYNVWGLYHLVTEMAFTESGAMQGIFILATVYNAVLENVISDHVYATGIQDASMTRRVLNNTLPCGDSEERKRTTLGKLDDYYLVHIPYCEERLNMNIHLQCLV